MKRTTVSIDRMTWAALEKKAQKLGLSPNKLIGNIVAQSFKRKGDFLNPVQINEINALVRGKTERFLEEKIGQRMAEQELIFQQQLAQQSAEFEQKLAQQLAQKLTEFEQHFNQNRGAVEAPVFNQSVVENKSNGTTKKRGFFFK